MNIAMSTPNTLAFVLGFNLSDIMRTNLFPEINVEIDNTGLDRSDMSTFEVELINMVSLDKNINVTIKNKEDKYGSISND